MEDKKKTESRAEKILAELQEERQVEVMPKEMSNKIRKAIGDIVKKARENFDHLIRKGAIRV